MLNWICSFWYGEKRFEQEFSIKKAISFKPNMGTSENIFSLYAPFVFVFIHQTNGKGIKK